MSHFFNNLWDGVVGASDIMGRNGTNRANMLLVSVINKIEGLLIAMVTKQAKGNVETNNSVPQNNSPQKTENTRSLHVKVDTFSVEGKTVGTRIVDMYHFGTRNWLQQHHWWAMHNNHTVEVCVASDAEVAEYLKAQKAALADKFNAEKQHAAS